MSVNLDRQERNREKLYTAHRKTIDRWWDDEGKLTYHNPQGSGSYRAYLWHCLAYLGGNAHCVAKANKIIVRNWKQTHCHFTPGAALDVLWYNREQLTEEAREKLEHYLQLNLSHMSTPDLRVHGYNDNHPYKAFHALIVGGEMFDRPEYVALGVRRMREAVELLQRNGFPCEYNSPTYTPVSLQPLASIVEQAHHPEARALALRLEQFYWQDLALHFDPRAGVPAGPHSRAYVDCYSGLLSGIVRLLMHLFPERFDLDLIEELYERGEQSDLSDPSIRDVSLPFSIAHVVWYARATYTLTPEIEQAIFEKPEGTYVRGLIESGTSSITWKPEDKPEGSPSTLHLGPRRSLCATWFGKRFSLGTTQHSWLDNSQTDGFYATVARGDGRSVRDAAVYYSRMFFDERYPYGETPNPCTNFRNEGDARAVQHRDTAMILYNPFPLVGSFKRLRLGLFRPILFSRPEELWVGNVRVPDLNYLGGAMVPVAIRDGEVYIGIVPLRLTDHGQSRQAHLQVHTYSDRLAILMSSFEGWGPRTFRFEEIMETNAGFLFVMRNADAFGSFAEFREWLAAVEIEDQYESSSRRTVTCRCGDLSLSARYSPYQTGFQHATVNGRDVETPQLAIEGMPDPRCALSNRDEK